MAPYFDLNSQEDDGNTALCVAYENGQAETARVLLNHGATLDYQNKVYTNMWSWYCLLVSKVKCSYISEWSVSCSSC